MINLQRGIPSKYEYESMDEYKYCSVPQSLKSGHSTKCLARPRSYGYLDNPRIRYEYESKDEYEYEMFGAYQQLRPAGTIRTLSSAPLRR